ncbi:hypothetical protein [Massilia phyllosphaerae]|uniref:hypothetical protein n=1 Tax=Massilia phyllosphaerae TaxID=3106034 RepID=UPI002B1CCD3A|nr:hypothetical protein [Massilia sp. SGZ-792]
MMMGGRHAKHQRGFGEILNGWICSHTSENIAPNQYEITDVCASTTSATWRAEGKDSRVTDATELACADYLLTAAFIVNIGIEPQPVTIRRLVATHLLLV